MLDIFGYVLTVILLIGSPDVTIVYQTPSICWFNFILGTDMGLFFNYIELMPGGVMT